jgi:hypothetical protein
MECEMSSRASVLVCPRSQTVEDEPCSDELRALVDGGFDSGLKFLSEQGGPFAPFLVIERPDGASFRQAATGSGNLGEAIARKYARGLSQDVRRCALVRCQRAAADSQSSGTVLVEASQRDGSKSVVFAREYRIVEGGRSAELLGSARVVGRARSLFARRRWHSRRWLIGAAALFVGALALLVVNNNYSFSRMTRDEFRNRLDLAVAGGTEWLAARKISIACDDPNPVLLYMVRDMANLSEEARLRDIVALHLATSPNYPSRRMIDEKAEFVSPGPRELALMQDYQRWLCHACAPSQFPLEEDDRAAMLSPTMHCRGSLTHQLFALCILRQRGSADENLDALIDTLCERVAAAAAWDFRVTDMYIQRAAFLAAAGRPDLIKRRWIERILAWQQENGGWKWSWHGWGSRIGEFHSWSQVPNAHTTVQGVWLLYLLKYRYPQWIEENYPDSPIVRDSLIL